MSCPPVFLENKNRPETSVSGLFGGDKRDRTADLLNAIQALSPYKRVANPLKEVVRVLLVRRNCGIYSISHSVNLCYNLGVPQ